MFLNSPVNTSLLSIFKLNRKHEMFLNLIFNIFSLIKKMLNRKHEMFLNGHGTTKGIRRVDLTVNMKCF